MTRYPVMCRTLAAWIAVACAIVMLGGCVIPVPAPGGASGFILLVEAAPQFERTSPAVNEARWHASNACLDPDRQHPDSSQETGWECGITLD